MTKTVTKRPNIVILNPDQWRGDVLGHMGNPAAITPNLDRMVREDTVSFQNAFCQNTVCTPSRCSFMSGWYPHVHGHRTMHHMMHIEHGEPVLLKTLKDNGYFVWWGGKNDLVPGQDGFDKVCDVKFHKQANEGKKNKIPDFHNATDWRGSPDGDNFYSFYVGKVPTDAPDGGYYEFFNTVADLIRSYKDDKPFCLYLPLGDPHPPYRVDDPWFSMIDRLKLPPRIPAPEGWKGKPGILKGIWERQHLQKWNESRWSELRATYYAMCTRLDFLFQKVVDALKDRGIYDDTAIFMFSDHGDFTGDYGLVEKTQNTFEDCLSRVPFLIKPPKWIPVKPRVSKALVELLDFPATVEAMTGIKPEHTHFGRSLLPVISGETDEHRDAVFCEGGRLTGETHCMERESTAHVNPSGLYWPRVGLQCDDSEPYHTKAAMCRTANFKYVRRLYEDDELYDLKKDPGESVNQVHNPHYAQVLAELKDRLLRWYQETCDVVPLKTDKR